MPMRRCGVVAIDRAVNNYANRFLILTDTLVVLRLNPQTYEAQSTPSLALAVRTRKPIAGHTDMRCCAFNKRDGETNYSGDRGFSLSLGREADSCGYRNSSIRADTGHLMKLHCVSYHGANRSKYSLDRRRVAGLRSGALTLATYRFNHPDGSGRS